MKPYEWLSLWEGSTTPSRGLLDLGKSVNYLFIPA